MQNLTLVVVLFFLELFVPPIRASNAFTSSSSYLSHGKGLLQTSEREVNEIRLRRLQDELQSIRTGQTVFLDAGFITFSQSILIEVGNITIRGSRRQETTVRCPDEGDTTAFILREAEIRIEALTFTGCRNASAVVVDARTQTTASEISVSFVDVRFLDNGRLEDSTVVGAGFKTETCLEENCTRPQINVSTCVFEGNTAIVGGAIYGRNCDLRITDSTFKNNEAIFNGGAVYITGGSRVEIHSSQFVQNNATQITTSHTIPSSEQAFLRAEDHRSGGGAIYAGTPSHFEIQNCTIIQNFACTCGGGIRISNQYSDRTIEKRIEIRISDSLFTKNGINCSRGNVDEFKDPLNPETMCGGAVASISHHKVSVFALINGSRFLNNSAVHGGAVFIQASSDLTHRIESCVFRRNLAESNAGALFIKDTHVLINGSRFRWNSGRYGGAIGVWDNSRLTVGPSAATRESTIFKHNAALHGGGIEAKVRVALHLEDVVFRNNTAMRRGGALCVYETSLPVVICGGRFFKNFAMIGGGVSLTQVSNFTLQAIDGRRPEFANNTATLGGGLYCKPGLFLFMSINIQDADFVNNQACGLSDSGNEAMHSSFANDPVFERMLAESERNQVMNHSLVELYYQLTRMPDGEGGGFAMEVPKMSVYVIAEIVFRDLNITGNMAHVGGGGSLHTAPTQWNIGGPLHCFPASLAVDCCQIQLFQNVNISNNEAVYGAGIFVTLPETIMLTCNRDISGKNKTLLEVMKARQEAPDGQFGFKNDLFCTDIHSNRRPNSTSIEGANIGSIAASLHLENSTGTLESFNSGEKLTIPCDEPRCRKPLTVLVKDAFNQTIQQGTRDASLDISLSSHHVVGDMRYTAVRGRVKIKNTRAWGINIASAKLRIQSVHNASMEVKVTFSTKSCNIGEHGRDSYCMRCPPDQYGFNASYDGCEACDPYAICEGGASLVPKDGYWHSTPFSPRFYPCLDSQACTYNNRSDKLTNYYENAVELKAALEELELYLEAEGELPDFSGYQQCAEGYEGLRCGSCQTGFGNSLNGECIECPSQRTVSILLGMAYFLWTFIILGANAAITLLSAKSRIRLVEYEFQSTLIRNKTPVLKRSENHITINELADTPEARTHRRGSAAEKNDVYEQKLLQDRLIITVHMTETLKILLNYLQVNSASLRLQANLDGSMDGLISAEASLVGISSDSLNAAIECQLYEKSVSHPSIVALWIRVLTPFAVVITYVLVITAVWLFFRLFHPRRPTLKTNISVLGSWTTAVVVVFIVAVYFSFIDVVRELLKTINCIHLDDQGASATSHVYDKYAVEQVGAVWAEDTDLQCFKGVHRLSAIGGIFGLILELTATVLIIIWLPLNSQKRTNPNFIARYWFLYQGYKRKWYTYGWEAVILTRKALLDAIIVFAVHLGPNLQAALCVGILLCALMIQTSFRPFIVEQGTRLFPEYFGDFFKFIRLPSLGPKWIKLNDFVSLNGLESGSLFASLTVFFYAVVRNDSQSSQYGKESLGAVTFLVNVLYLLFMLCRLYAGVHSIIDFKLELDDPSYMAVNPNGAGFVRFCKKACHVLGLVYKGYANPSQHLGESQIALALEMSATGAAETSSTSEIKAEP